MSMFKSCFYQSCTWSIPPRLPVFSALSGQNATERHRLVQGQRLHQTFQPRYTTNMIPSRLSASSTVRKQNLLVEFSSLKYACPQGVYMSLTPGNPSLWSGVMFIRKGPYAPAILRFQISFPPSYPELPPLVTFSTDIFHPLITPLTTYIYTTDFQDSGNVSARDEERLPPGGFSLRNGFPNWFGRASRRAAARARGGVYQTPARSETSEVDSPISPGSEAEQSAATTGSVIGKGSRVGEEVVGIYDVLRYIRSSLDDATVLDKVTLEAAGNPGAWHAWRSHRVKAGISLPLSLAEEREKAAWHDGLSDDEGSSSEANAVPDGYRRLAGGSSSPTMARRPGEWNWDGVWEVRVKKGIDVSLSEAVLFGGSAGDDLIRFLKMELDEVETIKENIRRSVENETADHQRRGLA